MLPSNTLVFFATVAVGGALGAMARYGLSLWAFQRLGGLSGTYLYGTLLANWLGAFCIGILFVFFSERQGTPDWMRLLFIVGFTGAFTTFSTFSLEMLQLMQKGELLHALSYLLASVVGCLVLTLFGLYIGRFLFA